MELRKEILKQTGWNKEELQERLKEKQEELSNLISEEGALHIIAKELNITVKKETTKIKDLVANSDAEIIAKVVDAGPVREFDTEKAKGRVRNVVLADETGSIKMVLWNEETEKEINNGDVLRIKGYVRDRGGLEFGVGGYGLIEKVDMDIKVSQTIANASTFSGARAERKDIASLEEGPAEIRAAIVQVFETEPYYNVCPVCDKSMKEQCKEHGKQEPKKALVVNTILDDGTGSIRGVFFKNMAEKIVNDMENVLGSIEVGKEFVFRGNIRKNDYINKNEFVVNSVDEVDIGKEIKNLL
jgi:ssDNA-binding replication factor A large subunit